MLVGEDRWRFCLREMLGRMVVDKGRERLRGEEDDELPSRLKMGRS